jgi:hypothetical protein
MTSPAVGAISRPAHIREGACANLNTAPTYPLADVRLPEDGAATLAPMGRMTERLEVEMSPATGPARLETRRPPLTLSMSIRVLSRSMSTSPVERSPGWCGRICAPRHRWPS